MRAHLILTGFWWKQVYKYLACILLLCLQSCQTPEREQPLVKTKGEPSTQLKLLPFLFRDLPGWSQENFKDADVAWQSSCRYYAGRDREFSTITQLKDWQRVCQRSHDYNLKKPMTFMAFLQDNFDVFEVSSKSGDNDLFTGYFEPLLQGSRYRTDYYTYPVYKRPSELIIVENLGLFRKSLEGQRLAGFVENGRLKPYYTHRDIARGILENRDLELAWVHDPLELFWMQIQGSGQIVLSDDEQIRVHYDGSNGHIYTGVGNLIKKTSGIPMSGTTMPKLKIWCQDNSDSCHNILWTNQSYVFFKEMPSDHNAPRGHLDEALTPLRSVAIDPKFIPSGAPLWIDTPGALDHGHMQRLMFGQDSGGVIKGPKRIDIYWGSGEQAGRYAGMTKSKGRVFIMLPKPY